MQKRYLSASVSARMLWLAIGVVLSLGLSAPAIAQAPPPLGPDITGGGSSLTSQQTATINAYVDYYAAMLTDSKSKPEDVQKARDGLLEPVRKPNISLEFRNTYSRAVLNKLEPILNGQNVHVLVNAIIVISQLGTSRAIDELMAHCDRQQEPRWQTRLAAVTGMGSLLRSPSVDPRKVVESIRKLSDATKIEDNKVILGHLFAAIAAADSNVLKEADRQQAREVLIDSLTAVIDRIAKGENNPHASPLIEPAQFWVGRIRQKYADPAIRAELQGQGRKLGPALGQLLSVAAAGWDAGHADDDSNKLFTQAIGRCEEFLKEIDKAVRGEGANTPQTKLKDAWVANNKDTFTADLNQWLEVLKQPAYSKP